jgi:hypothetical protein
MNWARSHALTLATLCRAAIAAAVRYEPHHILEHRARFEQQVEGQNQDRDEPEHAADQAGDRDQHRPDRVAAGAARRVLHRLLERHLVDHQLVADQKRLEPVELAGQPRPQRRSLRDQWRNDQQADEDEHGHDHRIDGENREPARHAARPAMATRPFDELDEGRQAHRNEGADVDQEQRIARRPEQRDDERGAHDGRHGLEHPARELAVRRHQRLSTTKDGERGGKRRTVRQRR